MKKAALLSILVVVVLLAVAVIAEAQQPKKIPKVGFLALNSLSSVSYLIEGFRQGLRELGYRGGENIVIEYRSADEKIDRLPDRTVELVRLKVDVIVSAGDVVTRQPAMRTGQGRDLTVAAYGAAASPPR